MKSTLSMFAVAIVCGSFTTSYAFAGTEQKVTTCAGARALCDAYCDSSVKPTSENKQCHSVCRDRTEVCNLTGNFYRRSQPSFTGLIKKKVSTPSAIVVEPGGDEETYERCMKRGVTGDNTSHKKFSEADSAAWCKAHLK